MTPMTWRSRSRNSKGFWPSRTGWSIDSTYYAPIGRFITWWGRIVVEPIIAGLRDRHARIYCRQRKGRKRSF